MTLSQFPCRALASDNTVAVAANECDRRGFLAKRRCEDDCRIVRVRETDEGGIVLERGFEGIYRYLRASVWREYTIDHIDQTMHAFPNVVERLHISTSEVNHRCHPIIAPAYLMCLAGFLRKWEQTTRRYAGLSFTEYRCLALLEHRVTVLTCAALADELRWGTPSFDRTLPPGLPGARMRAQVRLRALKIAVRRLPGIARPRCSFWGLAVPEPR